MISFLYVYLWFGLILEMCIWIGIFTLAIFVKSLFLEHMWIAINVGVLALNEIGIEGRIDGFGGVVVGGVNVG